MIDDPVVEAAVDRVAELLRQTIGFRAEASLRGRLRRCVRDEAAVHGEGVGVYVDRLTTRGGALQSLSDQVTVQETGFFRHPEHFTTLARDILPGLTRPVSIWSAGCANGQEAFSLAMVLEELDIDGTVLATDLSSTAVARTCAGYYSTRELGALSSERIHRHLHRSGRGWQINADTAARVIPARHNLVGELPERARSSQVVFCRNVLIYFAPEATRAFLGRLADTLPAALVFLGAAETIWSVSDRFQAVRADDCYYYRPRPGSVPTSGRLTAQLWPTERPAGVPPRARRPPTAASGLRASGLPASGPQASGAQASGVAARPSVPTATSVSTAGRGESSTLTLAGQLALNAGDHRSAVTAFRKCTYLFPDDALAHLHLGLAFEASGDLPAARRSFATARRAVGAATAPVDYAIGGYATSELMRLLDTKQEELGL